MGVGFSTASETQLAVSRVMGREVVVVVTNGRLDFGTWERIFYGELGLARGGRGRRELWHCPVQAWSSGLPPIGFIVVLKSKLPN